MATHSSVLAWRIPWAEELGRLQSVVTESDTTRRLTLSLSHMVGDEECLIFIVFF